jgi:hypothetical protein
MPKVVRCYTQIELYGTYSKLRKLTDFEHTFYFDCCVEVMGLLPTLPDRQGLMPRHKLNLGDCFTLARLFNHYAFDEYLTKTLFYSRIGMAGNWKIEVREPFNSYFEYVPGKGVALSDLGREAHNEFLATLRRVLDNQEYFMQLKFGYFTAEEIEKRRMSRPFYRDLSEEQQIQVLREYYAMPWNTAEERKLRRTAKIEIYSKYGMRGFDLVNAIKRFGNLVTSIRQRPDIAPKFQQNHRKPSDS